MISDLDTEFMRLAVAQAELGVGRTAPNPPVGAVLVRDGVVISRGYHHRAGLPHAEVDALLPLRGSAPGATAYVTLEPCNHTGRTGPCTEALIAAGVTRVVVGTPDPNPQVAGGGLERLGQAGIDVRVGVLEDECRRLIAGFARWVLTREPQVTLKLAATLDGRIATATGESRWITGAAARADVHRLRDRHDAILIGAGTLRADDPALTTRLSSGGRDAIRVVVGSGLDVPDGRALFRAPLPARTILATTQPVSGATASTLGRAGVELWPLGQSRGRPEGIDFKALFGRLGQNGVTTVLVEGGARLASSLVAERRVHSVIWYAAPRLIGGDGIPALTPFGLSALADTPRLTDVRVRMVGDDVCIEGDCVYPEGPEGPS